MSFLQEDGVELIGAIFPEEKVIRAENQGSGVVALQLSGQRGFSRAREAAQEVEVFSKAVAARRWPPRGQRPRRRLLLPLLEAQPPERFQKTVLHGEGAAGEGPGLPS